MKNIFGYLVIALAFFTVGCETAEPVKRSDSVRSESVIFTRPEQYLIAFGSKSLNEYLAVSSSSLVRNQAGMLESTTGIQYCGPRKWYNFLKKAPQNIYVKARADFYSGGVGIGAPIYSTNRQTLVLRLGDSTVFKAVCPLKEAQSCQIVLSE